MSVNLAEIALLGASSLFLQQSNQIGGIQVDTTLEESYEDALEITEHPVEAGAAITDHSFKRPMELVLTCGWSDSSSSGLIGLASGLIATQSPIAASILGAASAVSAAVSSLLSNPGAGSSGSFTGGAMAASDYVAGIYSNLLHLQESHKTISVTSGLRFYDSMLIQSLRVRRDQRTQYALNVQAVLRQIIIVSTQTATLAPQSNQANPASTADTVNTGAQQLQSSSNVSPLTVILPPQSQ
jgi:hypothetical protein